MCDCGLDMSLLGHYRPCSESLGPFSRDVILTKQNADPSNKPIFKFKEDSLLDGQFLFLPPDIIDKMHLINVVVLTNPYDLFGIIFITKEYKYSGHIYATEPCFRYAKLLINELVDYIRRLKNLLPRAQIDMETISTFDNGGNFRHFRTIEKITDGELNFKGGIVVPNVLDSTFGGRFLPKSFEKIFGGNICLEKLVEMVDSGEIEYILSLVRTVSFGEVVNLFQGRLKLTFLSSGLALGCANVMLEFPTSSVFYISRTSTVPNHARPLDRTVKKADVVVVSSPVNDEELGFVQTIRDILTRGGSALLPCLCYGYIFDIILFLNKRLSCELPFTMYVISTVGKSAISHFDIFSEWLSEDMSSLMLESLSPFKQMIEMGRLCIRTDCNDLSLKYPAVVFCGHVSASFGDFVHLVEIFNHKKNAVILTDPNYDYTGIRSVFTPKDLQIHYAPIKTFISSQQLHQLITSLSPKQCAVVNRETYKSLSEKSYMYTWVEESISVKVDSRIPGQLHYNLCGGELSSLFVEMTYPVCTLKECDGFVRTFLDTQFGKSSAMRSLSNGGYVIHKCDNSDTFYASQGDSFCEWVFSEDSLVITSDSINMLSTLADMFYCD